MYRAKCLSTNTIIHDNFKKSIFFLYIEKISFLIMIFANIIIDYGHFLTVNTKQQITINTHVFSKEIAT